MAIFRENPWVNPFGKMSILRLFELVVFIAQKYVFSFQNITEDIFLAYIPLKKEVGKMAIFGEKPWVKPFGKMSLFRFFDLLVFIAQKGVLSFQNIIKDIFFAYICKKKNVGKWPFLEKNHLLSPLEKCHFFDFLNLLFSQPKRAFCRSRIS